MHGTVVVGVSGGADSLCLALLLHKWCKAHDTRLIAVTFDHGLRVEAAKEALYVQKVMSGHGIEHHILKNETPIGSTKIQETARTLRYEALFEFCKAHNAKTLAVAHHLDDQTETFFMRLAKGSGLKGLRGMTAERQTDDVKIIRPLLSVSKKSIIATCEKMGIDWVEDPSNEDTTYTRIQFRQAQDMFEDLGLSAEMIEKSRHKLSAAEGFIESELEKTLSLFTQTLDSVDIPCRDFNALHPYMKFRVITQLLQSIGRTGYPPKSYKTDSLITAMAEDDFKAATLNGCLISKTPKKTFKISPEHAE